MLKLNHNRDRLFTLFTVEDTEKLCLASLRMGLVFGHGLKQNQDTDQYSEEVFNTFKLWFDQQVENKILGKEINEGTNNN